jgi:hypothetical protein
VYHSGNVNFGGKDGKIFDLFSSVAPKENRVLLNGFDSKLLDNKEGALNFHSVKKEILLPVSGWFLALFTLRS